MKWKLREIVVMAALSVVFAVVYLAFLPVGSLLAGALGPIGWDVVFGIWFIVSIIAAYIIRKPGAAFISETVAAAVEVMLGNMVGPMLIVSGMIQGLGAETVFALTRYKRYSLPVLIAAGMGAAAFSFAWGFYVSGLGAYRIELLLAMFAVRLLSGAVLAGILGKWVADALNRTGVLRSFAIAEGRRSGR
jgi:energy-coupling factor transport system substrate-specific component